MKNTSVLVQGDLCLFNLSPSVGHEFQGKRPALIIQSDKQIAKSNLITIMPLTSNLNNCLEDDILLIRNDNNNLFADSVVKVYNIVSVDYERFINKIGKIDNKTLIKVKSYLKKHFEI